MYQNQAILVSLVLLKIMFYEMQLTPICTGLYPAVRSVSQSCQFSLINLIVSNYTSGGGQKVSFKFS